MHSNGITKTLYTTCRCNCGSNAQCVIKAHVRDGVVVAVEPDDRYNTGIGREDAVMSESELIKTSLQRRPCAKGLAFHKYIYLKDRIIHPLKRRPGTQRGEGLYDRISWEEALTTIATEMERARNLHGPYSVMVPYMPNGTAERLFSFWGAGVNSWGFCSYDGARLMSHIIAGEKGWDYHGYMSGSAADMLANSKLIVIWGYDPAVGSSGPANQFGFYLKLCRERGKKVIIFDPRYTVAAEKIADQWIPIRPGTDQAMFLALAYELFINDHWDKDFVARWVEPKGFYRWRHYVMGQSDGQPKTPEWAESICAVPAETIKDLAKLLREVRPAFLLAHWSLSRKSRGEDTVKAFAALQAMQGYWGTPGAGPPLIIGPRRNLGCNASWGSTGEYVVPKVCRSHDWAKAVLYREQVRTGSMSRKEYIRITGWRADPDLVDYFEPRVLFWGGGGKPHASDHLVTACESSDLQVEALKRMDFVVTMHSMWTASTLWADVILPAQDWMWEEQNLYQSGAYGGFESVNYCPGVVSPPGEVKPWVWVYTKLAEKLGIDPEKFFRYYTTDENWDRDWEQYQRDCYSGIEQYYNKKGVDIPSFEDFRQGAFINCDELDEQPFTGFHAQMRRGEPFQTASGKIELYSSYLADETKRGQGEHVDHAGRVYDNLAADWGPLEPSSTYRNQIRGLFDPMAKEFPLMMLCPHGRYRVHYLFWDHPWLKDHVYRHRVWLNAADASARNIKDNDQVRVFNDMGQVIMPAYVTNRIMPGLIVIHNGGKYLPKPERREDRGGSPSTLLGGDHDSCVTAARASTLVEVVKWQQQV